jgi:hypothetical protein
MSRYIAVLTLTTTLLFATVCSCQKDDTPTYYKHKIKVYTYLDGKPLQGKPYVITTWYKIVGPFATNIIDTFYSNEKGLLEIKLIKRVAGLGKPDTYSIHSFSLDVTYGHGYLLPFKYSDAWYKFFITNGDSVSFYIHSDGAQKLKKSDVFLDTIFMTSRNKNELK